MLPVLRQSKWSPVNVGCSLGFQWFWKSRSKMQNTHIHTHICSVFTRLLYATNVTDRKKCMYAGGFLEYSTEVQDMASGSLFPAKVTYNVRPSLNNVCIQSGHHAFICFSSRFTLHFRHKFNVLKLFLHQSPNILLSEQDVCQRTHFRQMWY
jgi:hypothetical protein